MINYSDWYSFSEDPFDPSPKAKCFFSSDSHREALASLQYGLTQRKGFVLILGEAGTGKTTLLYQLMNTVDAKVKILLIPHSLITIESILKEILDALQLPVEFAVKGSMMHKLYYHLIHCLERNEIVAIIIDEAQEIRLELMEELRLLANLETGTSKLLQIVLVGQPKLREKLRDEAIRQFKQRIAVTCQISPLTNAESAEYIDHRLNTVGSRSSAIFTDDALSLICAKGKGNPQLLNTLCRNALSIGYYLPKKKLDIPVVKAIRNEKAILSESRAQMLAMRIKKNLIRKIAYAFLLITIFVVIMLFVKHGRYLVFTGQEATTVLTESNLKSKTHAPQTLVQQKVLEDSSPPTTTKESLATSPTSSDDHGVPSMPEHASGTAVQIRAIAEVKRGSNLYGLAYKFYNDTDETFLDHILKLNPGIRDPNLILVNQKIRIPEITDSLLIIRFDRLFKVHVKTFKNIDRATQYAKSIIAAGTQFEVMPLIVSPKETWYRVMATPFSTEDEALKFIAEMKKSSP